ncbi:VOC family protein [Streptomyces sp. NPDC006879]|uniref:VOC family protein n=1 Tax=Streptomyces sp. NPDC006879 TaxID=3364767 RepID=UPI0036C820B7
MATKIFVNLPVKDLDAAKDFWGKLGYTFNPQFTDDNAASMVISDSIFVMLLTHKRFADFTDKDIADTAATTEALLCLSAESRAEVDELAEKALAAGGAELRPASDHGFMYGRAFEDLDGHNWEVMWMDPAVLQGESAQS